MSSEKTGFDRYFEQRMKDPGFADAYERERAVIDSTDELIRVLDARRASLGLTKASIARAAGMLPALVRRLLTSGASNPTLETVLRVVHAVGFRLELVEESAPLPPRTTASNSRPEGKKKGRAASGKAPRSLSDRVQG